MNQRKEYTILVFVVWLLIFALLMVVNVGAGLIVLIGSVVAFCALYKKYPWIVGQFRKASKESGTNRFKEIIKQKEPQFTPHILLINNNSVCQEMVDVDAPSFTIGRALDCNYVIRGDDRVSRHHAVIRYDETTGRNYLIDENSRHGTRLNGIEIEKHTRQLLHNGDIIQIESCVLGVQTKNV